MIDPNSREVQSLVRMCGSKSLDEFMPAFHTLTHMGYSFIRNEFAEGGKVIDYRSRIIRAMIDDDRPAILLCECKHKLEVWSFVNVCPYCDRKYNSKGQLLSKEVTDATMDL